MNSKKGFRISKGDFLRGSAVAAVLIVAAMSTAALWVIAASGPNVPSASSSQPATPGASVSLAGMVLTVGGMLVALMVVVLTVDYGRRRIARRRAGGRRGGTHAKASGPRTDGATRSVTGPSALNRPAGTGDYWSTGTPGLGPPDLPRPAAGPPGSEDEYPTWPGPPGPYALHPDHPSWPGGPDPRWSAAEAILREDDYLRMPQEPVPMSNTALDTKT